MSDPRQTQWARDQRALAKALGLSIEEWLQVVDRVCTRKTGLTAAVVGAAMAEGLGLSVLDALDADALAAGARALIDPAPPRVSDPVLAEAVRRADELDEGAGARRLKRRSKSPIPTPQRDARPIGDSATEATPDAPGGANESS